MVDVWFCYLLSALSYVFVRLLGSRPIFPLSSRPYAASRVVGQTTAPERSSEEKLGPQCVVHDLEERRTRFADRPTALRQGVGECDARVLEVPRCPFDEVPSPSCDHQEREECSRGGHQRCPLPSGQTSSVVGGVVVVHSNIRQVSESQGESRKLQSRKLRNADEINKFPLCVGLKKQKYLICWIKKFTIK